MTLQYENLIYCFIQVWFFFDTVVHSRWENWTIWLHDYISYFIDLIRFFFSGGTFSSHRDSVYPDPMLFDNRIEDDWKHVDTVFVCLYATFISVYFEVGQEQKEMSNLLLSAQKSTQIEAPPLH